MAHNHQFAGAMLEKGAASYAGLAASLMQERHASELGTPDSHKVWKSHITQRVLELSAALNVGEPELFANRATWFRKALKARKVDDELVANSLECLRDTLSERLPEAGKKAPIEYINLALSTLKNDVGSLEDSELNPGVATDRQALNYLQKVLEGNSAAAINSLLDSLQDGQSPASIYCDVLLAAQREIGRLWHIGDATVAEEHLVTSSTIRAMAIISHNCKPEKENGKTLIAASVANNAHDVGVRAIADLYQLAGWRVIYLGSDVPVLDLPVMVGYFDADLLVISATLDTQIPIVANAIQGIRERSEQEVKIMVGGYAFDQAPSMASTVGADAYTSTVTEALTTGTSLTDPT